MLSCQQTQNVIDGKKRIILNPSESQKREFETITFAENEVYGMDILISTGEDGKVIEPFRFAVDILFVSNRGLIVGSSGGVENHHLPA